MPVIGTLTVNLEANTAKFSGDLGKAADDATKFGKDAEAAGEKVDYSMGEARHSVMIVGEEFGVHLPRALTSFIASLGPIGPALEAAFPFLAIILAATLLIEHLSKVGEAAEKAAESSEKAFTSSNKSLEEATVRSLELRVKLAELTGGPVTTLEDKLRTAKDLLASMKLAPELKSQFEDLIKGIQIPSNWNPLNWFGDSKAASEEVKAEAQSAALAIANATTLEEKQINAARELSKAQQEAVTIQKSGSEQAIDDQNKLIRLLELTKQQLDAQVSNKKDENKVADIEKERKAAEDAYKEYEKEQKGLEHWEGTRRKYFEERVKDAEKEKKQADEVVLAKMHADEAFTAAMRKQYEEQNKIVQRAADESLKEAESMARLKLQAAEQAAKFGLAMGRETAKQATQQEVKAVGDAMKLEVDALNQRIAVLDKSDKDYLAKLQEFEGKKRQVIQQGENQITAIRNAAEEKQHQDISRAEQRIQEAFAQTAARSIVEGKNMAQAFAQIGGQMLEQAITNALQMETVQGRKKLGDAKTAAADAYAWAGNPILGAVLASVAFASVMAFERGGEIPGVGAVPIIAHGGETVVTRALTDQVRNSTNGGSAKHHITYAPTIHAVDADGVERMLEKHSTTFIRHFTSQVRRMNKG